MDEIMEVLFCCPLFAGLKKPEIKEIMEQTKYNLCYYKKNEYIFRADQTAGYIGIIIQGSVEVQKIISSGKAINVMSKNKGDVFGGAAIFSSKKSPNVNILTKESCKIILIHKQSVFDILCKNSIIASNILSLSANSISHLNQRIELLSFSSIQKKIAFSLLFDMQSCEADVIHLPFPKNSWAEYLNVSRPSLCRELKKLCAVGDIDIKNRTIKIINREKLQSLLMN
ncbi:Hypothetical protein LUCI_4447 [Lucifera butyrica]|uniref:Cyclic nucleotide-binding domain-containing protein n=1 Tax=Lucifera butyrica TaxID=1351585 RepID=A0A498RCK9_9FIRM|nr:Crp/Fnr family transcriptional regulator [Lucifera butyrica]VBB09161.1 Hypothetical protein LUCI_4447 [Lucifera butyrica]